MSEETKRNGGGGVSPLITSAEDRKSSSGSNPGKKVIIKSADMKEDVQKEAVDIAIGVIFLSLSLTLYLFPWRRMKINGKPLLLL